MKKIISLLLALLLCLGCLMPAFAKDAAEPAGTTEAAKTSEEPALPEEYIRWAHGGPYTDRGTFDRSFRTWYTRDPDIEIVDHMVFFKAPKYSWRPDQYIYRLIDFFDSDETERTATSLNIPAVVNGFPITVVGYNQCSYTAAAPDPAFANDTVKKVTVAEGLLNVGEYTFRNFTALKSVKLPSTLRTIGRSAFENCVNLKKVTGAVNLENVQDAAFKNCKKLASFGSMECLLNIEGEAFSGCAFKTLTLSGFARIVGPNGDLDYYADSGAFKNCKKLESVTFLPGRKTSRLWIGGNAFQGCSALQSVTFPKKCGGVNILHRAFQDCTALTALNRTAKLQSIGSKAFARCTALESLLLPEGIEQVAEDAFKGCKNLKTIDLRSNDVDLFGRTYNLWGDYFYGSNATEEEVGLSTNFVKKLPKKCTLFVVSLEMKQAAQLHDCTCKVKIEVDVNAPKALKATQKGSAVTLKWSKVKDADGYRLYAVNAKTGQLTALKTVAAPTTSVTLKTGGKRFAVKAFRDVDGDTSWSKTITN